MWKSVNQNFDKDKATLNNKTNFVKSGKLIASEERLAEGFNEHFGIIVPKLGISIKLVFFSNHSDKTISNSVKDDLEKNETHPSIIIIRKYMEKR